MANLPGNTSYQSGPSIESLSNLRKTLQRNPTMTLRKPSSPLYADQKMEENQNRVEVPAGEPLAEQKRQNSIPQGYGTFDNRFSQPTNSARIINFGGGQLVTDPSQPGSFIRTERPEYDKDNWIKENTVALGNRSSQLYEVDHIVPLWAGGADTAANKTVLTWDEHNRKTNAQAVPLTLLSNGIISAKEAQLLAVSWKDKDLQDVPQRNKYGLIDVKSAKEIYDRWNKQKEEGTWIKDNKAITGWNYIKEAFSLGSLKEGAKKTGDYMVPDFVPGHKGLEAVAQGFASGMTGGFIPGVDSQAPLHEKLLGMAGSFAGMLLPVSKLAKLAGVEAKIGNKVAIEALKKAGVESSLKTTGEIAGDAMYKRLLGKAARGFTSEEAKKHAINSAVAYTKAFVAYGQLSREGLLGKGFEKMGLAEEGQARPGGRFIEDVVYGLTTGLFPPNLKGAMQVAATPILLSGMMQPFNEEFNEDWLSEALVMSAVMGGLHMVGNSGLPEFVNKPGTLDAKRYAKQYNEATIASSEEVAANLLETSLVGY